MMNPDGVPMTYSPHMNRSPRSYNQTGISGNYQRQVDLVQQSRASASPHHHARQAMAARNSNMVNHALTSSSSSSINNIHNSTNGDESKPSEWKALDLGGMLIKTVSPALFRYDFLTTLYLNHNMLQTLSPDIRFLRSLVTLDISGNKLKSLPPELGLISSLRELLAFDNEITVLPYELGFLFQLEVLGLQGNPIQEMILALLQKEGTMAVVHFLRDNCPEGPQPPEREWIVLDDESSATSSDAFTILCYNTLSDKYAVPSSYGYTPSWVLDWNYRKELITQEIMNYAADIICLQEVETSVFLEYLQPLFNTEYESMFSAKSRARTMDEFSRRGVDGCATFFKKNKFIMKDTNTVEFQLVAMKRSDLCKTEDVYNRVMIKDNIALLTLLEHVETKQLVLVANVHLHWDPQYRDVKVVQCAMLLEEIESFMVKNVGSNLHDSNNRLKCNLVICGDFNSLWDSGVVEFILNGHIPPDHPDFNGRIYGQYTTKGVSHVFNMKSAYPKGSLQLTNYTPLFRGVIDHVFYAGLHCTGILNGIDSEYLSKSVGFPNWHHPSDHIPLLVSFKFPSTLSSNNINT